MTWEASATLSETDCSAAAFTAILVSLPSTSIPAIAWLCCDTRDTEQFIQLTQSIFWVVLPSLVFFLVLPLLLKAGMSFFPAVLASSAVMVVTYWLYTLLLGQLGSSKTFSLRECVRVPQNP